jgi:hypothetical protein
MMLTLRNCVNLLRDRKLPKRTSFGWFFNKKAIDE